MPGTLTHHWILYQALKRYSGSDPLIRQVQASNQAARDRAQYPPDSILPDFLCGADELSKRQRKKQLLQQMILASCAYIGCHGPDIFYASISNSGNFIADLLHYNKTGLYIIAWLRKVKLDLIPAFINTDFMLNPKRNFAYCLGHMSHIAADICTHAYINTTVAAYPDNLKYFYSSNSIIPAKLWKFHNILEHHHDAYVLYNKFYFEEGFSNAGSNRIDSVNIGAHASAWFLQDGRLAFERLGLFQNPKDFYGFAHEFSENDENLKYQFFTNPSITPHESMLVNIAGYFNSILPDIKKEQNYRPKLFNETELLNCVEAAIDQTYVFWQEAVNYLTSDPVAGEFKNIEVADMTEEEWQITKQYFPQLRKHWNLDCGLYPLASNQGIFGNPTWMINNTRENDTQITMAGTLQYQSLMFKDPASLGAGAIGGMVHSISGRMTKVCWASGIKLYRHDQNGIVPNVNWYETWGDAVMDGDGSVYPGVYLIKGKGINTFKVTVTITESSNLSGKAVLFGSLGDLQFRGLCPVEIGEHEVEVSINNLPNTVQWYKGDASWGLAIDELKILETLDNQTRLELFVILAKPLSLYEPYGVWLEVLRLLCTPLGIGVGGDLVDTQTFADAAGKITLYLHTNHGLVYDSYGGESWYVSFLPNNQRLFQLSAYLVKAIPKSNCHDQAAALQVFAAALGVPIIWYYLRPFGYMQTANLVGGVSSNNPFYLSRGNSPIVDINDPTRTYFDNHSFNGLAGSILDACAGPHLGGESKDDYLNASIDHDTGFYPAINKNIDRETNLPFNLGRTFPGISSYISHQTGVTMVV